MAYEFGVTFDDIDDLNEALAESFWRTFGDIFGEDEPMLREEFNNWTDSLRKDGHLCDNGYNYCDLVYTVEDAKRRRWI